MSGPTIPAESWALVVPAEWWEAMGEPNPEAVGPVKVSGIAVVASDGAAVTLAVTKGHAAIIGGGADATPELPGSAEVAARCDAIMEAEPGGGGEVFVSWTDADGGSPRLRWSPMLVARLRAANQTANPKAG
ncbi:MAG: hypothetical protein F4Y61_05605 [Rhodothermaceae bacterium]|nr:hypothetical protein [Rhodothermaceae bacterium]